MAGSLQLKRWIAQGTTDAFYENYVQFGTVDTANVSSGNFPIGRPAAGSSYSIEVLLFLEVDNPPINQISNIRFWGNPGAPATGMRMYVGTAVSTSTPTNTKSSIAVESTTLYPDGGTNLDWSSKTLTISGNYSYYLVLQLGIDNLVDVKDYMTENMVFHYSYDES